MAASLPEAAAFGAPEAEAEAFLREDVLPGEAEDVLAGMPGGGLRRPGANTKVRWVVAGALSTGLPALLALTLLVGSGTGRLRAVRARSRGVTELDMPCGTVSLDTNLITRTMLEWVTDVDSADGCQERCEAREDCAVWILATARRICVLKALGPNEVPTRQHVEGVVSGSPCPGDGRRVAPPQDRLVAPPPEEDLDPEEVLRSELEETLAKLEATTTTTTTFFDGTTTTTERAWMVDPRTTRTTTSTPPPTTTLTGDPAAPPQFAGSSGPSLFCLVVMQPDTEEQELISMQYDKGWSIFSCGKAAVYSSEEVRIGTTLPVFQTSKVDSDLKCQVGGKFLTALNTHIFMKVWEVVFTSHLYLIYDWTVKVDPDTVFIPSRLRTALAGHEDTPEGVYLNNCKFGLHGPMEVFSKNALKMLRGGMSLCDDQFNLECSGPCPFGEDMFFDKCLHEHLYVTRRDNFDLMEEAHCQGIDGDKNWTRCDAGTVAAFHPFKHVEEYTECVENTVHAESGLLKL